MPSALVTALAAPIREVQSLVGPGWSSDPAGDPATALGGVRNALAEVSAAARRSWSQAEESWFGAGADAAADFAATTVAAADALAERVDELGEATRTAGEAVSRANERLRDDRRALRSPRRRAGAVPGLARRRERAAGGGPAVADRGRRRGRRPSSRVGRARRRFDRSDGADLPGGDDTSRLGESLNAVDGLGLRRRHADEPAVRPGRHARIGASAISPSSRHRRRRYPMPRRSATASRSGCPTAAPRWRRTPWPPAPFGTR